MGGRNATHAQTRVVVLLFALTVAGAAVAPVAGGLVSQVDSGSASLAGATVAESPVSVDNSSDLGSAVVTVVTNDSGESVFRVVEADDSDSTAALESQPSVIGPATYELWGQQEPAVPYVTADTGALALRYVDGDTETLVSGDAPVTPKSAPSIMAVGAWNTTNATLFVADAEKDRIHRVGPDGDMTVVADPDNGVQGVVGPGDIDGDGVDELVFADGSQAVRYVEPDDPVTGTFGKAYSNAGQNNGVGVGTPADFDGDGAEAVPIVDGSNQLALVDAGGKLQTLTAGAAAKVSVGPTDIDADGTPEVAFRTAEDDLHYVDDVGTDPAVVELAQTGADEQLVSGVGLGFSAVTAAAIGGTIAAPTARTGPDRIVNASEQVTLSGANSSDDGEIIGYEWDLNGDGITDATGVTVTTSYDTAGSYEPTVTVTGDDGLTDTATQQVTVTPNRESESNESRPDPGGPPAGPANRASATATGDPHIVTFGDSKYDFQGVGEFVLARAPNGSLSVQARLDPWRDEDTLSGVEAVATEVDGTTVTIDAADDQPVTVDDQRQSLATVDSVSVGNGTVYRRGGEFVVVYPGPDGETDAGDEQLRVRLFDRGPSESFLNVEVQLRADRANRVEGLLGTVRPERPDPILADGSPVTPSTYEALYANDQSGLEGSWVLTSTDESSLHHESGETPLGFYNESFPAERLTLSDLGIDPEDDTTTDAEQAALDAGLTPGTDAFQNAVLDYAATGEQVEAFLEAARESPPAEADFQVETGDTVEGGVGAPTTLAAVRTEGAGSGVSDDDVTYAWQFGDGTSAETTDGTVEHTYSAADTYTARVTATGPEGEIARDTVVVDIGDDPQEQAPVAAASVDRLDGTTARADASGSVDPDGEVELYAWDIDEDGVVDRSGQQVNLSLDERRGSVELLVVDDDGLDDRLSVEIPEQRQPPVADAGPDVTVTAGEAATVDAGDSSDPDNDTLQYEWAVVDDPTGGTTVANQDTSTGEATVVAPGSVDGEVTVTVQVTVTDDDGLTGQDTATVTVVPGSPADIETVEQNNADATVVDNGTDGGGELSLQVFKCSYSEVRYTLGEVDGTVSLSYDYKTQADQWYEIPAQLIRVDGDVIDGYGYAPGKGGTQTGSLDESYDVSGTVEIIFRIQESRFCGNGDHANTYFDIENIDIGVSSGS